MKNSTARMTLATMIAATMGALGGRIAWSEPVTPKMHRYVPTMVTASPEEIAAWNEAVDARKPNRPTKLHRKQEGSARQYKRVTYLRHEGYADKHPTIAARYGH
jgi:hypothetical protein